ncbi:unnamed protein product [Psylliodes chrysocephalus]|uniref:Pyroglutamyl-peptidase I n=1 Tax=Psylliodes chrysocephalus TaxID=3402493 RepID=A0A9P0DEY0_9CUCU|nr:unnamed protein product [Psylliodes chrysocephala]
MSDSIVVTGFGPFFGHTINASWEAVRLLPDEINGITIIKKEIPVQYSHIQTKIPQLWEEHKPLLVIHVGVSGEAKQITLEKCAKRDGYKRLDVTGATHSTGTACDSGEECIYTGINVADVCAKLNNTGKLNACMSSNAGRSILSPLA